MKKELLKLSLLVVCIIVLTIGIILVSDNTNIVKNFAQKKLYSSDKLSLVSNVQNAYSLQEAFVSVIEKIKPTVVSITTVYTYEVEMPEFYFGDPFEEFFREFFDLPKSPYRPKQRYRQYKAEGGGSGFIISPDGYILTNEHVVKDATEIKVIVNIDGNEKEYKGKIIGKDTKTDIAIIKINAKNLPYAKLGDSDKIRIGEWVIAIGSPFGLEQTVTVGIVSALRQRVRVEGREYRDFIQTDAAINRGNSGGPLCNLQGEVIGINTAIYAPTGVFSGIGFAIPINRAKEILDSLIQKGKVSRGWLGIEIVPVDDAIANQFGLGKKQGVLVNRVLKNTPAEKAGIQRGDIILSVKTKGKVFEINSPQELQDVIFSLSPKEKVELKIVRLGKEQNVEVILSELPEEPLATDEKHEAQIPEEETFKWLGHVFANLDENVKERLGVEQKVDTGVIVRKIDDKDKNYEDVGLAEMDIIVGVNRVKVRDVNEFKKVVSSADIRKGIVFDIIRNGREMYISYIKQ